MKTMCYRIGRTLQFAGLLTLPSAIWISHFDHNEKAAIGVLAGSFAVFVLGYFLARGTSKI